MIPVYINDVPIECINRVAVEYRIPATYIVSVLKTENGRVGTVSKNSNGTSDLGPMQINTSWLPKVLAYGFTAHDLIYDACKNVEVGAWILSLSIAGEKELPKGIGDYHSHTKNFNQTYSDAVLKKINRIESVIND